MADGSIGFHREHVWTKAENGIAIVGISDFAQDSLGDIVYIDLPKAGAKVSAGETVGEIESVKSTSDLYSPVSGTVTEVNQRALDEPEVVNDDPYGQGWLFKVELSDKSELNALMDEQAYAEYTKNL